MASITSNQRFNSVKHKMGEHSEFGQFEPLVFLPYVGFNPEKITKKDERNLGELRFKTSNLKFWSYGIDKGMFDHYYNFFGRNELKNPDIQKAANILIKYIKDEMIEEAFVKYYDNDVHNQNVFIGRFEHLSFDYANICDSTGKSFLMRVIEKGDVDFVKFLLRKGAEINSEVLQKLTKLNW
jgi:hypothetical protein